MLLCAPILIIAAGACSGSKSQATPAAVETTQPTPGASTAASAPRDLASRIGDRGALPKVDPIDLALRYGRTARRPAASKPPAPEAQIGDRRTFSLFELSGSALAHESPPVIVQITATLEAKSAHAYFYADSALDVRTADMQTAADQFESSVWPKVTGAFGDPPIPGVDGDPRVIVLQADLGGGAGGYVAMADEYLKSVEPLSNEAEMMYMSQTLRAGSAAFNVVLAHEFQHVVHEQNDRAEQAWVNEGLSEDASMLVGGAASTIDAFEAKPQTQLNAWDSAGSSPHYGAGAAFFRYLTSRFGGDASYGAIAREPGLGTVGVDQFLASTGQTVRFRDVFADWIAANILNDGSGPYANPERPMTIAVNETLALGSPAGGSASQFGTEYYRLDLSGGGAYALKFKGAAAAAVLPTEAPGAGTMTWSNAEDGIDTTLTREVDLTGATAPALTFKTWYDIERWFDWGYVSVSTDGGSTWKALAGDQTSTDDPTRVAYGPGYTGESGGGAEPSWVSERVSLAAYAGQKVMLRFEYVTDSATHGEGWAIDDLAIPGAPAAGDAADGWRSDGWVLLDAPLPQTYIVRVIERLADGGSKVIDVRVAADGSGELRFTAEGVQQATLAIAGSTEGTDQKAAYTVSLSRP